jgi:hypothetical protein
MKRLGRHMGWLGWVVAGVLALSAGGVAWAATSSSAPSTTAPSGNGGAAKAHPKLGGLAWGRHLGGRALHGEVTVQTKNGTRTVVLARGKVSAYTAGSSISITSSDNTVTTFTINSATRYGFRNFSQPEASLKTGETAMVVGTQSGSTNTANRVITVQNPPKSSS